MSVIKWQPGYATGVARIDAQHRELVTLVNRLYQALRERAPDKNLRPIVAELIRYTEYHFAREEDLMRINLFPELARHETLHRELEGTVRLYQERLETGEQGMGTEIYQFVRRWLLNHIVVEDRKVGAHVRQATDSLSG